MTTRKKTEVTCPGCGVVGPVTEVAPHARKVAETVFRSPQPRIVECPACGNRWRLAAEDDDE
jgi:ribosomal protein S27E